MTTMKRMAAVAILAWPLALLADFQAGLIAYGQGDYATALEEWQPLAEQGDATAQYNLGLMYVEGKGVPQDDAEAMRWYRKAAEQGLADAQTNLGTMYDQGKGVPQDDAEAMRWYRKAAEQGYADAQTNLGTMYAQGNGVPKDYVHAYVWYNLAAAQGDEHAINNRDVVRELMTATQIAEAQKLSRELYEQVKKAP